MYTALPRTTPLHVPPRAATCFVPSRFALMNYPLVPSPISCSPLSTVLCSPPRTARFQRECAPERPTDRGNVKFGATWNYIGESRRWTTVLHDPGHFAKLHGVGVTDTCTGVSFFPSDFNLVQQTYQGYRRRHHHPVPPRQVCLP